MRVLKFSELIRYLNPSVPKIIQIGGIRNSSIVEVLFIYSNRENFSVISFLNNMYVVRFDNDKNTQFLLNIFKLAFTFINCNQGYICLFLLG